VLLHPQQSLLDLAPYKDQYLAMLLAQSNDYAGACMPVCVCVYEHVWVFGVVDLNVSEQGAGVGVGM